MMSRWWLSLLVILALTQKGLSLVPAQCPNQNVNCYFDNDKIAKIKLPPTLNYFAVGGLFDVHKKGDDAFTCGADFNPAGILHTQAFLWSVNYWRQNVTRNSPVAIGAVVFDSCEREAQLIQNLLGFEQCNIRIEGIDRHNLVGFVGPTTNMQTMAAARVTADMDLTLISPSADALSLTDPDYKYFLRTTPTIKVDVEILGKVLGTVGTSHVAAIYEESEMPIYELFQAEMRGMNVCISASQAMSGDDNIAGFVENTLRRWQQTRYVALFLTPALAQRFISAVRANQDVKNMNFVFLTTSDLPRSSGVFTDATAVAAANAIIVERAEPSSILTAVNNFKNYWASLTLQQLEQSTDFSDPFTEQFLRDGNSLPDFDVNAASTIMATRAFVAGVSKAGNDKCLNNNYLCTQFFADTARGHNIHEAIRSSTGYFTASGPNSNGADLKRDQIQYNIYRFQDDGTFAQVGRYSNDAYQQIIRLQSTGDYPPGQCHDSPCTQCGVVETTTTIATTTTTTAPVCEPKMNGSYSLVYYPPNQEITGAYTRSNRNDTEFGLRFDIGQRWIIALGVLAGLGILAVIVFEIYILYKLLGTHMGQKWRTMWLGQLLLFGIFLCYLTLFAYLPVPTKATCGITRFGVGVSYSICFAVLLVKLMVILTSKSSDNSLIPGDGESPNYLKGIYQFLMFVFVVGVQVVIDAQWLITVPPDAIKVISNNGDEVWVCNHYTFKASGSMFAMTDMSNFVRNEFENHILSLVYIMFLILITTLLALNAHGIITNHRESVFIGIAAGFSIPIWLAWTLVGGLNRDHEYAQEFGDACIAFGLFLTATLILFAMFLPKVRQLVNMGVEGIYFEDDRDTYYAGSVIMAPPSYKSRPNSVIYVNNQGIYSEPVVVGNGDTSLNYLRHPGTANATPGSTYSAPPTYLKKGADSTIRGGSVLRVTDDLSGRRPMERKRPMSEVAYGTASRPRSVRGTLPRSRSHSTLGAL